MKSKQPLIRKHGKMVLALTEAAPQYRKKLIREAPKGLVDCISECCHNVLKGNVHLSEAQKRHLHSRRQQLRQLADKKVPVHKKKIILNQKGGFLPLMFLAPLLAKTIVPLAAQIIKKI
jgi:hypothetical protein